MKTLFSTLAVLLLTALPAFAQRFPRVANTLADMVASNPYMVHTNVFVADSSRGGMFYWLAGSTAATNLLAVYPSTYPGVTGRYFRVGEGPVELRWSGAKGDGVADDTAAIQATLNYISATSRQLHASAGIYNFTATLSISNMLGLRFSGDGVSNTTFRVTGAIAGPAIKLWNIQSFTLEDFRLDCQKLSTDGILVDTDLTPPSSEGEFSHIGVIGAVNNGIQLASSTVNNFQVDFTLLKNCLLSQSATNLVIQSSNALEIQIINSLFFGFGANNPVYNIAILNGGLHIHEAGFTSSTNYDIYVGTGAGLTIDRAYSESQSLVNFEFLATDPTPVAIRNFQHNVFNTNGNPVINWNRAGTFTLQDSKLGGNVYLGYGTNLFLFNNTFSTGTNGFTGSSDAHTRVTMNSHTNTWGFGTVNPWHKLDVLGQVRLQSTNRLFFRGTGAADADVNLFGGGPNLLESTNTMKAPIFTPDQLNVFQAGVTNDVTTPALGLENNKMLAWKSNTGAYTNGGFIDYDAFNRLRFGAENSTRFYMSNGLVSIPGTVDLALTNVTPGSVLYVDSDYRVKPVTIGSGLSFVPPTLTGTGGAGATNAIVSLNTLTNSAQTMVDGGFTGSSSVVSAGTVHTFSTSTNFPMLSVSNNIRSGVEVLTGTTPNLNFNTQKDKTWALSGNSTPTISNVPTDTNFALTVVCTVTNTTFTINWPDSIYWPPADTELNPLLNTVTKFVFVWDGIRLLGYADQLASAGSGSTINPTDGFIPYRFDSTTFSNSPLQRVSAASVVSTAPLTVPDGTEALPGLAVGASSTGILRDGTGAIGLSVSGNQELQVSVNAVNVHTNAVVGFSPNPGTSSPDVTWRIGSGTPEGVVAAQKGSWFMRRDGDTNTMAYVKSSGSGNTGWTPLITGGGSGGGGAATAWQQIGTGTDFSYTGTAIYEKISFGTSGPSIVLTNAGTYQIIMTVAATANNTFSQGFYLTNITDGVSVPGSIHDNNVSSSIEAPTPINVIYTTTAANKTLELWGFTMDPAPAQASVIATRTVADVIRLDNLAGSGGAGTGDFVGPASSTDNNIVRFDGTTGKLGQNSNATISDAGLMTLTGTLQSGDDVYAAAAGEIGFTGRSEFVSIQDGFITARNAAGTDFTMFRLGGATTSFPGIRRTNAEIAFLLADYTTPTLTATRHSTVHIGSTNVAGELALKAPLANPVFTSSLQLPNSAAPVTDAIGEIALDVIITDHKPLLQYFDGNDELLVPAFLRADLPTTDNYVMVYDAAGDKFTFEAQAGGGGSAPVGTMVNTTTPVTLYELFRAQDTTGTNAGPSAVIANGTSLKLGLDKATPDAQRITGGVPTGADTAGATLTIQSPSGTGTAAGGSLLWQVSPAGASSSVTNPAVTGITLAVDAQIPAALAVTVTGRLRVGAGTAALPSIVFELDDDSAGTGIFRQSANILSISSNGSERLRINSTQVNIPGTLGLGNAAATPWVTFTAEAANIFQQSSDGASPSADTFKGPDGVGSNISSVNNKIGPGRSTGAGIPAHVQVEVGTTGAAASSQNAYATAVGIGGTLKVDTTTTGNLGAGEDDLISYTIPAGQLSKDGSFIEFDVFGTFAANANTAQLKVFFDGVAFFDTTSLIFNGVAWRGHGKIIRTGAATQKISIEFTVGGTLLSAVNSTVTAYATDAATLSGAIIFKVTGQDTGGVPADNKVVQEGMVLKWYPGQ